MEIETMPRTSSKFRQSDVTKAIKAVVAAGVSAGRAEIEPSGKIVVVFGETASPAEVPSALDDWRKSRGPRAD